MAHLYIAFRNIGAPRPQAGSGTAAAEGAVASFHFSAQVISRAKGRSALAAAAYRSGERLRDDMTGVEHDFSRRRGIVHTEIMLPDGAAPWLADRQQLWNHVHQIERRRDAQLAREINLALPHELAPDERLELLRDFVRTEFTARGMVADLAIHAPTDNDPRNHHAHVMLTLRKATPTGLHRVKTREWNSDAMLTTWREAWAGWQNRYLARGNHSDRVDHRTLAAQRQAAQERGDRLSNAVLNREPEIHIGPRAQNAARRGRVPPSRQHETATARPRNGSWRSARDGAQRQRTVDYQQVDRGTRAAYNAWRSHQSAEATARRLEAMQNRNARLRLIEARYARTLRSAVEGLRTLERNSQQPFWRRADGGQMAARQTLLRTRAAYAHKRLNLLAQLLGRVDAVLAGLFRVQNRAFTRSRTLEERLLPRVSGRGRDWLAPGRVREVPW